MVHRIMPSPSPLQTPLCELLGIKYPILLAGMARTSGGPLAAAVSNAGGMGCIGGLGYTPTQLQEVWACVEITLFNS
jgi:NAD(P)H-dependent flavin oxidoreductase YrpB (nitropropane dioxygenase family)